MKLIYGNYYCTEDGRVFSVREIKPQKSNGYYRLWLTHNGTIKQMRIHRLVWEYFNGEIPKGLQINHINGVKTDNRLSNLELCTQSENMQHALKMGLRKNHRRKPYKVLCIELNKVFNSIADASKFINVHYTTLHGYFKRNAKTCGGYTWKKLEE